MATFTCHLVVKSSVAALVDTERSCLRTDTLVPERNNESCHRQRWKRILHLLRTGFSSPIQNTQSDNNGNVVSTSYSRITGESDVSVRRQPIMEVLNLSVPRAGVHIGKLSVDHGDRIKPIAQDNCRLGRIHREFRSVLARRKGHSAAHLGISTKICLSHSKCSQSSGGNVPPFLPRNPEIRGYFGFTKW